VGNDRVIWEWLFARAEQGVFYEAGANHPVRLSQTYLLEQMSWTGVLAARLHPALICSAGNALSRLAPGNAGAGSFGRND